MIHEPNIPGTYAILLFTVSDVTSITSHIHNCMLFLLCLRLFILSGGSSPLIGTFSTGGFNWCTERGERSYPTSEVRGRRQEDPMPEGKRPRGVTHHPRSGAAAKSARLLRRRKSREALSHTRGQGLRPGGATPPPRSGACMGTGGPRGAILCSRSEGAVVRRYP